MKKFILFSFLFVLLVYLFYGPLFPWSPVKIGFKAYKVDHLKVFVHKVMEQKVSGIDFDEILNHIEETHGLEFQKSIRIVVLDENSSMKRFVPWLKGSGFSVQLGYLNLVYIGSIGVQSPYGIEVYIKHELSHLIISHNTSPKRKLFEMQRQGWLSEGLAGYYGGPVFHSKQEFLELCNLYNDEIIDLPLRNPLQIPKEQHTFYYSYYRLFVSYLVEFYGPDKIKDYLAQYIEEPQDYQAYFATVYDSSEKELMQRFKQYLQN